MPFAAFILRSELAREGRIKRQIVRILLAFCNYKCTMIGSGESDQDIDDRTQFTASDAMVCKHSAASKGYFEDTLVASFINIDVPIPATNFAQRRKPPIINRGYFARVHSINSTIQKFITAADAGTIKRRQIISLGSGFDTLSLRLLRGKDEHLHIYEVDFEKIIRRKVGICLNDPVIRELLIPSHENNKDLFREEKNGGSDSSGNRSNGTRALSLNDATGNYSFNNLHFLSGDLRNAESIIESLLQVSLDPTAPTLILTECVMVYMEKSPSMSLCRAFSELLSEASWLTYDMISPTDIFGRTMLRNLTAARFNIPGFIDFPTLELQSARFLECGWDRAKSDTMLSVYDNHITLEEKHRISRLEIFDEIEEWQMLMSHYSLTVAVKGNLLLSVLPLQGLERGVAVADFIGTGASTLKT